MFSLIITIVSVALVAALALATIYYGGSSFTQSNTRAQASTVVNQAQQVMGAMEVFNTNERQWPQSIGDLAPYYLKTLPTFESAQWEMPAAGQPAVRLTVPVSEELCKFINLQSRGDNGILTQAYPTLSTQCYGASLSSLTVVVAKSSVALTTSLAAADVASSVLPSAQDALGASTADPAWLTAPTTIAGGSSGGAGGGSAPVGPAELQFLIDAPSTATHDYTWAGSQDAALVYVPAGHTLAMNLATIQYDGDAPITIPANCYFDADSGWNVCEMILPTVPAGKMNITYSFDYVIDGIPGSRTWTFALLYGNPGGEF